MINIVPYHIQLDYDYWNYGKNVQTLRLRHR
jgi:hypothetical protein